MAQRKQEGKPTVRQKPEIQQVALRAKKPCSAPARETGGSGPGGGGSCRHPTSCSTQGSYRVHLRIGGFTIPGRFPANRVELVINPAAARFSGRGRRRPTYWKSRSESGDLVDDGSRRPEFDSGGPWRMFRHSDGYHHSHFLLIVRTLIPYKTDPMRRRLHEGDGVLNLSALRAGAPVDHWSIRWTNFA